LSENVILFRRKTIPFSTLEFSILGIISSIITGNIVFNVIIIIICISLLFTRRILYNQRHEFDDLSFDFDYSKEIYSISRILNTFKKSNGVLLGYIRPFDRDTIKHNNRKLCINQTILSGGTMTSGANGSGKSTTIKAEMFQAIDNHQPVVFFDFKGEEEILDEIESVCNNKDVDYYEFSARKCSFSYDPFKYLNDTGKIEALMNTKRWSTTGEDEHYKTSMKLVTQSLVNGYEHTSGSFIHGLYKYAVEYKPTLAEKDGYQTILKMLEILMTSRANEMFTLDREEINFRTDKQKVVCFSFISANKELANSMSAFILQDIMDRGTNEKFDPRLLLCLDEFGTLENSLIIKDILEKGRSCGIQPIVSTLDLNQIALSTSMIYVNALLGIVNNFIIHAGATKETAALFSGTQRDNIIDEIMNLRKPYRGKPPTAIFISKYPIIDKHRSQEYFKFIPYNYKVNRKREVHDNVELSVIENDVISEIKENEIISKESIDSFL
jgi:hypothetical protein